MIKNHPMDYKNADGVATFGYLIDRGTNLIQELIMIINMIRFISLNQRFS